MNNDATPRRAGPFPNLPWLAGQLQQSSARVDRAEADSAQPNHARRAGFLEDLIKQIDMVIYCELSILCYMDCSLWRFMLRLLPHWFLSNPPSIFLLTTPTNRSYLSSVFFTNSICAFLHLALNPPTGNELSRGYIHGAFLTDFVGEPAPVSKWKMILIDFCILALQLLLLSAVLEKRELKLSAQDPAMLDVLSRIVRPPRQDLDAEEQGIRRSQDELQANADLRLDLDTDGHLLDESYGGQSVIMTCSIGSTLRKAWKPNYGPLSRRGQPRQSS